MTGTPSSLIPPANPHAAYLAQREAIDSAVRRVLDSGWYILGCEVESFEREFAAWLGTAHAVGVANGTDALELALRAIHVGPGDEVIAPAHTASATIAAIEHAGAVPVLVDIEPQSYGIDPDKLATTIKDRRDRGRMKAIVVVHLYGHPARLDDILTIAHGAGIPVVEDCAQAHGAREHGRPVGTFGAVAAFSFYPTKNLGALGDGGAVATNDGEINARVRMLREYGWRERYNSEAAGINSRLDELQAAILRAKLPHLEGENERRRHIASLYDHALRGAGAEGIFVRHDVVHAFHQYAVCHPRRDDWRSALQKHGVGAAVLYPKPVHAQPAYSTRVPHGCGGLGTSERVCREVLCLPVYPQLSDEHVRRVAEAVAATLLAL